jgi:hypothetical protein
MLGLIYIGKAYSIVADENTFNSDSCTCLGSLVIDTIIEQVAWNKSSLLQKNI